MKTNRWGPGTGVVMFAILLILNQEGDATRFAALHSLWGNSVFSGTSHPSVRLIE